MESAKVYAENAIRAKKEALNTRRFGVKMEALASKVEGAARTQQMSETIKNSVPALTAAMKQMEAAGVAGSVGEFEKVFEDMEVKTGEMDAAMENVYATSIDAGEVNALLQEMTDASAMGVAQGMTGAVGTGAVANPQAQA